MRKLILLVSSIVLLAIIFYVKYLPTPKKTSSQVSHSSTTSDTTSNISPITEEQTTKEASDSLSLKKRNAIDTYLTEKHYNGTALIVQNDKIILEKSYGYNDIDAKLPNTTNDLYPVGSITKYITAISILQLQEQGKLSVEDTLDKYFPYSPYASKVKLKHLLTHSSGIRGFSETNEYLTRDEVVHKIMKRNLLFNPGTSWNYTDANYAILGAIVEKASGESYDSYIDTHIFKKANIKNAYVLVNDPIELQLPHNYIFKNNTYTQSRLPSMTQVIGSGNLFSSAHALYEIDRGLMNYEFISPNSLNNMGKTLYNSYGFGLYHTPPIYANNGVFGGFITSNLFNQSMYVVLLSNVNGKYKPGQMVYEIRKQLLHIDNTLKKS